MGGGSALDNLAPTFILIDFWVGLAFASVLFGDVFRAFSPWRVLRFPGLRPYPERWGRYPPRSPSRLHLDRARLGLGRDPAYVATAALAYTLYTVAAQLVFGTETWSRRGEAFAVYYNLISRLSIWERRGRVLGVRPPLGGLPRLDTTPPGPSSSSAR